ncbi:MAG: redoxin domain-containing protein [Gemmobacter sp.]
MLIPRQTAPAPRLATLDHGTSDLFAATPDRGTILCFYRGLHCPICATYLTDLEMQTPAFAKRGYQAIAIRSDGEDRARAMADRIGASTLRLGHGPPMQRARDWGLCISTSRGKTSIGIEEPALFSEPGLVIVNADRSLYYLSVQSMPFVRPGFRELLGAIDFAIDKSYPARGEHTGPV